MPIASPARFFSALLVFAVLGVAAWIIVGNAGGDSASGPPVAATPAPPPADVSSVTQATANQAVVQIDATFQTNTPGVEARAPERRIIDRNGQRSALFIDDQLTFLQTPEASFAFDAENDCYTKGPGVPAPTAESQIGTYLPATTTTLTYDVTVSGADKTISWQSAAVAGAAPDAGPRGGVVADATGLLIRSAERSDAASSEQAEFTYPTDVEAVFETPGPVCKVADSKRPRGGERRAKGARRD